MQESRQGSTLELVVNEQQMQNMSQVDLSRPEENQNQNQNQNQNRNQAASNTSGQQQSSFFNFEEWPSRVKESFSAKIDEAKSESTSSTQFILKLIQLFSGTAIWMLCFFCTIILPVFLLLVGLLNLDNCQDKPSLPYLVLATGFTMSASNLFNLALALNLPILTNQSILSSDVKNTIASIINIIFNCVVAFLYILCAHKVYTIGSFNNLTSQPASSDEESNIGSSIGEPEAPIMNCNYLLYYFTFWFVTLTLAMFALLLLMAAIFFAYNKYRMAIIRGTTPRSQQTSNSTNVTVNTNPASAF